MNRSNSLCLLLVGLLATMSSALHAEETVWFVVAKADPLDRNDSYLLPLTRPQDIADARNWLTLGTASGVGSIVVARVASGGDGFNRDVRAEGSQAWSWHVTEFVSFEGNTVELIDGWPGLIEADPPAYMRNTSSDGGDGGMVGFWGYSIVAELPAPPPFQIGAGLNGAWANPATPGQGILIDVFPELQQMFVGWFTYGRNGPTGRPNDEHAWITAQGDYDGAVADLVAYNTTGGGFDRLDAVQNRMIGSVRMEFRDCDHATLHYTFDAGSSAAIPLNRIVPRPGCVGRATHFGPLPSFITPGS
jgi:hypothetical protein